MLIFDLGQMNTAIRATGSLDAATRATSMVTNLANQSYNANIGNLSVNTLQQQVYFGATVDFLWVCHKWDDMIHKVT